MLRPLGQGGMGIVYEAFDVRSAARVALKVVRVGDGATVGSIRREIAALATLRHPGIVRIVDQGLVDGLPWYAMELQRGTTLADHVVGLMSGDVPSRPSDGSDATEQLSGADAWLGGGQAPGDVVPGPKPEAAGGALVAVLTLLSRLCAPIGYLHGEGLVHRDLKPSNVVVRPDGTPIVIDFGIAGAGGGAREVLDVDAPVVGTAAYMAPEQVRGDPPDARADLYAFGCIAYELVTGRTPFRGESDASILHQKLQGAPEAPSSLATGVPPGLDALILSLLAGDPRDRPGYADDVARELKGLGAGDLTYQAVRARPHVYRPSLHGRAADGVAARRPHPGALRDGRGAWSSPRARAASARRVAMEAARAAAQGILVSRDPDRDGASPLGGVSEAPSARSVERCRNSDDADRFPDGAARSGGRRSGASRSPRTVPARIRRSCRRPGSSASSLRSGTRSSRSGNRSLVIDETPRADPLTADALNYLERVREHCSPRALLFVLTMRPDGSGTAPRLPGGRGEEARPRKRGRRRHRRRRGKEMLALPRASGPRSGCPPARRSAGICSSRRVRAGGPGAGAPSPDADGHWQAGAGDDVAAN
ncbi:MAG: protein kinase [Acidobacteriota bacterium]